MKIINPSYTILRPCALDAVARKDALHSIADAARTCYKSTGTDGADAGRGHGPFRGRRSIQRPRPDPRRLRRDPRSLVAHPPLARHVHRAYFMRHLPAARKGGFARGRMSGIRRGMPILPRMAR